MEKVCVYDLQTKNTSIVINFFGPGSIYPIINSANKYINIV